MGVSSGGKVLLSVMVGFLLDSDVCRWHVIVTVLLAIRRLIGVSGLVDYVGFSCICWVICVVWGLWVLVGRWVLVGILLMVIDRIGGG